MNRGHFLNLVDSIRAVLSDHGVEGDTVDEVSVATLAELFTGIWNNSSSIREEFKTKKDFIRHVNLDLKQRLAIKTRYEREPVI